MTRPRLIIGGIGGLALAVAVRNEGISAEVWEQEPTIREIGLGMVLSPNGTKALDWLSNRDFNALTNG